LLIVIASFLDRELVCILGVVLSRRRATLAAGPVAGGALLSASCYPSTVGPPNCDHPSSLVLPLLLKQTLVSGIDLGTTLMGLPDERVEFYRTGFWVRHLTSVSSPEVVSAVRFVSPAGDATPQKQNFYHVNVLHPRLDDYPEVEIARLRRFSSGSPSSQHMIRA